MKFIKKHQMKIMLVFIGVLFMFVAAMYYQYKQIYDAQVKYENVESTASGTLINYKKTLSDIRLYLTINQVDESLSSELNNLIVASEISSVSQLKTKLKPAQKYYVEHEETIYDLIDETVKDNDEKDTLIGMMNSYEFYSSGLMSNYELLTKYGAEYNKNIKKYQLIANIYQFTPIKIK